MKLKFLLFMCLFLIGQTQQLVGEPTFYHDERFTENDSNIVMDLIDTVGKPIFYVYAGYCLGLDIVDGLLWGSEESRREAEKKKQEQREAQEHKDRLARERAEEEELQQERAKARGKIENNLSNQSNTLTQFTQQNILLQSQLTQTDQAYNYLQERAEYFKQHQENPNDWQERSYSLTDQDTCFLKERGIDYKEYTRFYCNHLLNGIHKEHIAIISQASAQLVQADNAPAKLQICSFIGLAIQISHKKNKFGEVITSLALNDVCFHLLKPTKQGYLVGQLAKLQSSSRIGDVQEWRKMFNCLEQASQDDQELSACLQATKKYVQQFKQTGPDYQLYAIQVMTELSVDEFSEIPIQQQFELLEQHHQAIAIKALRSLNDSNLNDVPVAEYAIKLLKLENAHIPYNKKAINTLLDPRDSLERTRALYCARYQSTVSNSFLTEDGILKEHALIVQAHSLPLPPKHDLVDATKVHDLVHAYCTVQDPMQKENAYYGLLHTSNIANCQDAIASKEYSVLANNYYDAALESKHPQLTEWTNDLSVLYEDP